MVLMVMLVIPTLLHPAPPPPLWLFSEPFSSLLKTAGVHGCSELLPTKAAFVSCHRPARPHCLRG